MAVSIYIPINSARGFPFLHTLYIIYLCRLFDDGHSDWCEMILHCSFDFHFSNNASLSIFSCICYLSVGFPGGTSGIEPTSQCRRHKRHRFSPRVGKIPWRMAWQSSPVFLPGEFYEQWSLVGYSS